MFAALSPGRKLTLVAAVVGFVASLFPWYGISYSGSRLSVSEDGWHDWGLVAVVAFLVSGALIVLPALGVSLRALLADLPPTLTEGRLVLGAGVTAVVAVVLFMLTEGNGVPNGLGISHGVSFGAIIGLLCAVGLATGGYRIAQEPLLVPPGQESATISVVGRASGAEGQHDPPPPQRTVIRRHRSPSSLAASGALHLADPLAPCGQVVCPCAPARARPAQRRRGSPRAVGATSRSSSASTAGSYAARAVVLAACVVSPDN
jgi:hypothetical protein